MPTPGHGPTYFPLAARCRVGFRSAAIVLRAPASGSASETLHKAAPPCSRGGPTGHPKVRDSEVPSPGRDMSTRPGVSFGGGLTIPYEALPARIPLGPAPPHPTPPLGVRGESSSRSAGPDPAVAGGPVQSRRGRGRQGGRVTRRRLKLHAVPTCGFRRPSTSSSASAGATGSAPVRTWGAEPHAPEAPYKGPRREELQL